MCLLHSRYVLVVLVAFRFQREGRDEDVVPPAAGTGDTRSCILSAALFYRNYTNNSPICDECGQHKQHRVAGGKSPLCQESSEDRPLDDVVNALKTIPVQ